MRFKFLSISLFFLTFIFGFLLPKTVSADTFTLSGNVRDSIGTTIEGATVDVVDVGTNSNVATASTDSGGNYTIIVNEGTYNIQVTPPAGSNFSPAIALSQNISSNTIS